MAYLDYYVRTAADIAVDESDGLWIQAPKPGNNLWIVTRLSESHSTDKLDYQYHPRLQDALGKFLFKKYGYRTWTDVPETGTLHRLAILLARAGDSLLISKDGDWWVFEAETLRIHAVGELFANTAKVLSESIERHLKTTIYANDNCPLD